jgi:hypothetical protein
MKATAFTSRRLPQVGAIVRDRLNGRLVRVLGYELAGHGAGGLLRVRGLGGDYGVHYGRAPRYFDW